MGSSKKVTVGYRYFMGLHMAACYGPIDALKKLLIGERIAWAGRKTASGSEFVDARNLFGGDSREGGFMGNVDVLMGESTQGPNSYLQSQLGAQIPSYRGVFSAVVRGPSAGINYVLNSEGYVKRWSDGYVGSNNPYLKPWAFQVERITKGWECDAVWYEAKAPIEIVPAAEVLAVDAGGWEYQTVVQGSDPGNTDLDPPTSGWSTGAQAPFGGGTPGGGIWPGEDPNTTWPVETVLWARKTVAVTPGRAVTLRVIAENGAVFFVDGAIVKKVNTANIEPNPESSYFELQLGVFAASQFELLIKGYDEDTGGAGGATYVSAEAYYDGIVAMNPAHIVYQCVTDSQWGMGYPAAAIDDANFTAVADALYAEGLGLCLLWNQQTTIQEFIGLVMDHIGGIFYADPTTGKFKLKLIRDDYAPGTLEVFDESSIVSLESFQRVGFGETVNEVTVVYRDQDLNRDTSITVQDLASINGQGAVVSKTINYPGLPTAELAGRIAERDLVVLSTPLAKARIRVNRSAWSKVPGDVVKLDWPKLGLSGVIMRVLAINSGTLTDGTITVELAEDVFGLPDSTYAEQEPGSWTEPDVSASAITVQDLVEAPYWTIARTFEQAAFEAVDADAAYVRTLAARSSGVWQGYRIWSRVGAADFEERGTGPFSFTATLAADIAQSDTTGIAFANALDDVLIEAGKLLIIDTGQAAEWVEVTAVDLDAGTLDLARGVLDTTPANWPAGTRIWLADEYLGEDPTERATAETVDVRLATIATGGEIDVADATTIQITAAQRFYRPYPPGNLQINGQAYPTSIPEALSITWAHRDRTQQTAYVVHQDEADIGPEDGTTYNGYVYDDSTDAVLAEERGIADAQWEPVVSATGDIRIEIESERDGVVSWQRQVRRLAYSYTDNDAARLLEDGDLRLMEDGVQRVPEDDGVLGQTVDLAVAIDRALLVGTTLYGIYANTPKSIRSYDPTTYAYLSGVSIGAGTNWCTGFLEMSGVMYVSVVGSGVGSQDGVGRVTETIVSTNDPGSVLWFSMGFGSAQGIADVSGELWVSDFYGKKLRKIDPTSMLQIGEISTSSLTDGGPSGVASDGTDLYVVLRGSTSKLARIPTNGFPTWVVDIQRYAADCLYVGGNVWVLGTDELAVYDAADGAEMATFQTTLHDASNGVLTCDNVPSARIGYDGAYVVVRAKSGGVLGYRRYDPSTLTVVDGDYQGRYWAAKNGTDLLLTKPSNGVEPAQTSVYPA